MIRTLAGIQDCHVAPAPYHRPTGTWKPIEKKWSFWIQLFKPTPLTNLPRQKPHMVNHINFSHISSIWVNLIINYSNLSTRKWYVGVSHRILVVILVINGVKLSQTSWCWEGLDTILLEPSLFFVFFLYLFLLEGGDKAVKHVP